MAPKKRKPLDLSTYGARFADHIRTLREEAGVSVERAAELTTEAGFKVATQNVLRVGEREEQGVVRCHTRDSICTKSEANQKAYAGVAQELISKNLSELDNKAIAFVYLNQIIKLLSQSAVIQKTTKPHCPVRLNTNSRQCGLFFMGR